MIKDYLKIFCASFLTCLILTPIVKRVALRFGFVSFPKDDRWHKRPTAILGGIAIFLAAILPLTYSIKLKSGEITGFFIGSLLIFICGIIDDFKKIAPQMKILFQIIASCVVVYFGVSIKINPAYMAKLPPVISGAVDLFLPLFTIIWIMGITNALNLLDNMDGLCAGIAGIVSFMLFFSGLLTNNAIVTIISISLAGACFGFLPYNFKPAKIFMGDAGSMFLGFSLSLVALMGTSARAYSNILAALAVPVFILAVPIFDTALVTLLRTINGRSILKGGKDHTSHRLVSLGLSEKKTVVFLYLICILFGVIALAYSRLDVLVVSILAFLVLIVLFFFGMFLAEVKAYPDDNGVERARQEKIAEGKVVLNSFIFNKRRIIEIIFDFLLICVAYYSAYLLRFEGKVIGHNIYLFKTSLPWIIVIKLLCFYRFNLYRGIWHYVGISDLIAIFKATILASIISVLFITFVSRFQDHSRVVFVIDWLLTLFFISFSRVIFRLLEEYFQGFNSGKRILILGAGSCGELFLREIKHNKGLNYKPIGFIDDDERKKGKIIHGLPILGTRKDLNDEIREKNIEEVIIAAPSLKKDDCKDVIEACRQLNIPCHSLTRIMDTEKWA